MPDIDAARETFEAAAQAETEARAEVLRLQHAQPVDTAALSGARLAFMRAARARAATEAHHFGALRAASVSGHEAVERARFGIADDEPGEDG